MSMLISSYLYESKICDWLLEWSYAGVRFRYPHINIKGALLPMICRWLLPNLCLYTAVHILVTAGAMLVFYFVKEFLKFFLSVLQVFIQNPGGPESAWNLPDELSVGQAVQIRVSPQQGITKRCRLSWLSNSALVFGSIYGGRGEGFVGSQPMSTAVHMKSI